jgi:hypothetical protein
MQPNNFIIHQKAKQYQWKGECYLSIKSFDDDSTSQEFNC